jgi:hypothetical protein
MEILAPFDGLSCLVRFEQEREQIGRHRVVKMGTASSCYRSIIPS